MPYGPARLQCGHTGQAMPGRCVPSPAGHDKMTSMAVEMPRGCMHVPRGISEEMYLLKGDRDSAGVSNRRWRSGGLSCPIRPSSRPASSRRRTCGTALEICNRTWPPKALAANATDCSMRCATTVRNTHQRRGQGPQQGELGQLRSRSVAPDYSIALEAHCSACNVM